MGSRWPTPYYRIFGNDLISFLFPRAFATQRTIHWQIDMWNISQAFQNSPQSHLAGSHRVKDFPIVPLGLERASKRAYSGTSAELVLWHSVCQGTSFPPLTSRMLSRCLKTALLNVKQQLRPIPLHGSRNIYSAILVHVQHDSRGPPLTRPFHVRIILAWTSMVNPKLQLTWMSPFASNCERLQSVSSEITFVLLGS